MGLVGPLALGAATAVGLGWRAGLLVTVVLAAALALSFRGTAVPRPARTARPAAARTANRLPRRYWLAWCAMVLGIATEFTLAIWASQLLAERGLGTAASTASVTAIVSGMALGRLFGARLALRFPVDGLLLSCFGVTVAGFALFWAVEATAGSLVGLFVAGLGVSLQFPLGISRAVATAGGRTDLAVARGSIGAGLAIGAGPFLLGALADTVGIRTAFLVVPAAQLLAAALVRADRVAVEGPRLTPARAGSAPP